MKKIIVALLTFLALTSCNEHGNKTESKSGNRDTKPAMYIKLAGSCYFFGPQMDSANCKAVANCDCCGTDFIFVDDHRFLECAYCIQDNTFLQGTYKIDGDKVYLTFIGNKLDLLTDVVIQADTILKHGDTIVTSTTWKVSAMKTTIDTLSAFDCHGRTGFKTNFGDYGFADSSGNFENTMRHLQADSTLIHLGFN